MYISFDIFFDYRILGNCSKQTKPNPATEICCRTKPPCKTRTTV